MGGRASHHSGARFWAALCAAMVCVAAGPAVGPAAADSPLMVHVTETSDAGPVHLAPLPDTRFSPWSSPGVPLIAVDSAKTFQTINGFGAALTDSSAWLIHDQLPSGRRRALLEDLFGAGGLQLRFLRLPIGASDFTAQGRPYSYDELGSGRRDPHLRHFSIRHDRAYIIPVLKGAVSLDPALEILATPWSPPTWMKANHAFDNAGGRGALLRLAYRPLAEYFVKFIRAYAAEGIRITAVSPQNEPLAQSAYPGLELPWRTEAMWIRRYLKPALRAAGLRTEIYAADVGWFAWRFQDDLVSSAVRRELSGVAWHCYGPSASVMQGADALAPGLDQIVSECATQITSYTVTEAVIRSLQSGASTVALWNLALNPGGGPVEPPNSGCGGCRGLVTIDQRTHTFWFDPAYYQLGQFSRFIARGAVRLDATQIAGVDDVAARNPDGSIALVVYNHSRTTVRFAVSWGNGYLRRSLAPATTATFVWGGQRAS